MRILMLSRSFNGLAQRLWLELERRGHQLSLELDIADEVTEEAIALFAPELVIAPFLQRAIPASVWSRVPCLVVHPGIVGDRGPSALDWAISEGERSWGVTVLQANAEMDAGAVWAHAEFPLREASKSSVYRNELTEAAVRAVLEAVDCAARPGFRPRVVDPADAAVRGRARPPMRQAERRIDWQRDDTATVLRRIRAADTRPGVLDAVLGVECHLYDAHPEARLRTEAAPGTVFARREGALLRATVDGAVWIGHLRRASAGAIKLPATQVLAAECAALPESPLDPFADGASATWRDIRYEEHGDVGTLHFDFYNGAMSTRHCERLLAAWRRACERPTRVLVLAGGHDHWSNGIHLNTIEAAESPAAESWRNINAIDDLAQAIIETTDRLTVAALCGGAGAGGAFLALAADRVWARAGVLLNPHYRNMGNLYGSEYWTYLLPRRVGEEAARAITAGRLPMDANAALARGLVDAVLEGGAAAFAVQVQRHAAALAAAPDHAQQLRAKRALRERDEATRPLAAYRADELAQMQRNFFGFDPSYHVARARFVANSPPAWTPRHLARHRERAPHVERSAWT